MLTTDLTQLQPHLFFKERFDIDLPLINRILQTALTGGEFAECYFEYRIDNAIRMEENMVKGSSENVSAGAGIRVLHDEQTGYAYTNELTEKAVQQAARTAAAISRSGKGRLLQTQYTPASRNLYDLDQPITHQPLNRKIKLVRSAYDAAADHHPAIQKIQASLMDSVQIILIANNEGLFTGDVRPQTRLVVSATAAKAGLITSGFQSDGGRVGFDFFTNKSKPEKIGKKAAEEAVILLDAKDAPAGEQVVVLGAGQSGVMIHEAVGHPLEADANRKKSSIMWDKMHTRVAAPRVTIYDDPTLPEMRGSFNIDDEGNTPEKTMLIEQGQLTGLLTDKLSAKLMQRPQTGHGRREAYYANPIPRMGNTILAPGEENPDDIIKSVKRGVYAKSFQGGQVQDSGKFTFSVNLGYLIENGRLTAPLRNATLIGTNIDVLQNIESVGSDMGFFLGTCGKEGQSVPVTAGTPTLKISKMTVGGRQ